jgi:hypothetical protein
MHKKKRGTTASTLLSGLAGAGKLKILAAIYDLKTGVVTYIDRTEPTHASLESSRIDVYVSACGTKRTANDP